MKRSYSIKRASFITLGCKVNIYESNALQEELRKIGYITCEPSELTDLFVINTCTVTNIADRKSRQMISKARRLNKDSIIIVTGCYAEAGSNLDKLDCDILIGNSNKDNIIQILKKYLIDKKKYFDTSNVFDKRDFDSLSVTSYDHARVFIKIEDGCDQFCSYCIIPFARGHVRSKKAKDVISEIKKVCSQGYNEVVLSGIHIGKYKDDNIGFVDLVEMILKEIPELKSLRISSIEINEINEKFISLLSDSRLANHMHLPLQAGSNRILSLMNRPYTKEDFYNKVTMLREKRPNMHISTDIIVGFPTESDSDFLETIEFCKKLRFGSIHIFPYSKRDNTKASMLPDTNSFVKKVRVKELDLVNQDLKQKYIDSFIGQIDTFLVEKIVDNYACGHSSSYLFIRVYDNTLIPKNIYRVKILKKEESFVIAELI